MRGLSALARNPIKKEYRRTGWGRAVPAITLNRDQIRDQGTVGLNRLTELAPLRQQRFVSILTGSLPEGSSLFSNP